MSNAITGDWQHVDLPTNEVSAELLGLCPELCFWIGSVVKRGGGAPSAGTHGNIRSHTSEAHVRIHALQRYLKYVTSSGTSADGQVLRWVEGTPPAFEVVRDGRVLLIQDAAWQGAAPRLEPGAGASYGELARRGAFGP